MQAGELSCIIDSNEDLAKIFPIQQKRSIAFINHFIMKTVSFLNNFAQSCESRLMVFEHKMQRLEASLLILESQLSSIPALNCPAVNVKVNNAEEISTEIVDSTERHSEKVEKQLDNEDVNREIIGLMAKDDPRFIKFFKMLQFGVPEPAVRLKMQNECLDPNILDKPMEVIQ